MLEGALLRSGKPNLVMRVRPGADGEHFTIEILDEALKPKIGLALLKTAEFATYATDSKADDRAQGRAGQRRRHPARRHQGLPHHRGGRRLHLLPLVGAIASMFLLYPWTALLVKRLHDFGTPGRLVLVPALPAAASAALALHASLAMGNAATMGTAFAVAAIALPISALALLVGLGFLLWAGLKDGDPGANAFGNASPTAPLAL